MNRPHQRLVKTSHSKQNNRSRLAFAFNVSFWHSTEQKTNTTLSMRLVWTTENADHFRAFCTFLQAKAITFTTEEQVARDWSSDAYGTQKFLLWITDEDQVDACTHWLVKFIDNPQDPEFHSPSVIPAVTPRKTQISSTVTEYLEQRLRRPIVTRDEEIKKEFSGHIRLTAFVILLCSLLFLYEFFYERNAKATPTDVKQEFLGMSPIQKNLLFDYPQSYQLLDKIVLLYGPNALNKPQDLPEPGKFLYREFQKVPVFTGFYPYIITSCEIALGKTPTKVVPLQDVTPTMFENIKEGQVWRLFTPALLHVGILHLFFNMIWVLLLGTQIEARIGSFKFLALILISGIFSNVGQYLMSGPNFVGFSGVICAMATYIRARQQVAPWEAYQMSSSTFAFIMFFIGVMALYSFVTFFFQVFQNYSLPFGIANTAHLVGAITGWCLGRMRFFSWQLHN